MASTATVTVMRRACHPRQSGDAVTANARGRRRSAPACAGTTPLLVGLGLDDLLAAVVAARADVMTPVHFAAHRLDRERRRFEMVVRTMHAALGGRLLVLLDCHAALLERILLGSRRRLRAGSTHAGGSHCPSGWCGANGTASTSSSSTSSSGSSGPLASTTSSSLSSSRRATSAGSRPSSTCACSATGQRY